MEHGTIVNIGEQRFDRLRESGRFYIDKTDFIREWWEFSYFDSGNKPSGETEPERFYHGFVLGMMVNLADAYHIRSNRESGYGRYDVMLEPLDKSGKAFIFEFKVLNPYEDERTLADALVHAHAQIEKMKYETELLAKGFGPEQIRKYGFAFQGKHCLIG